MAVARAWREIHALRFAELSLECGRTADPGVVYSEDLRDWSDKETTPDQYRIERYIDRYDLTDKRILHIGIGNSGLARRFHRRVEAIVGTTIDEPEMKVARSLNLPNYTAVRHNKYADPHDIAPGSFDFIVDNNPTSPCCCISHLAGLFAFYDAKLAQGGQIVTDYQGLEWIPDESNPRWSFDFDDLAAVAAAAGFSAFRVTRSVYVLSRSPPPEPGLMSFSRHLLRRSLELPGRAIRIGPRRIARMARKLVKAALIASIPWAVPARYRPDK